MMIAIEAAGFYLNLTGRTVQHTFHGFATAAQDGADQLVDGEARCIAAVRKSPACRSILYKPCAILVPVLYPKK